MSNSKAHDTEAFTRGMIADPGAFPDLSLNAAYALSREQRDRIALAGLQRRFGELRDRIPVLGRMAADQGIEEIASIEAGAALLFAHTAYKSYPLSLIERGQFPRLTRWLQGLTTADLSPFFERPFASIDDWICALYDELDVDVIHTSGTSGKLSFLPRLRSDQDRRLLFHLRNIRDWDGPNSGPDLTAAPRPVLYPSYRYGGIAGHRTIDSLARIVARDEANVLTLYPEYFSADVASLAGRLRVAEERGEQGRLEISPALLARREEFLKRDRERPQRLDAFFTAAQTRFAGQDVMVHALLGMLYDWAEAGLARGVRKLFGPRSVLITGGGNKGRALPPNAREMIAEFLGFDNWVEGYGMSEMTSGPVRKCAHGHWHIPPFLVPYVLDVDTGAVLPRSGSQTGRFAFMDLFPADHWGGFVTGDLVTLSGWDEPCACGRTGPYVDGEIQRLTAAQGGDDKITCAGAPAAHDQAIEYLARLAD